MHMIRILREHYINLRQQQRHIPTTRQLLLVDSLAHHTFEKPAHYHFHHGHHQHISLARLTKELLMALQR